MEIVGRWSMDHRRKIESTCTRLQDQPKEFNKEVISTLVMEIDVFELYLRRCIQKFPDWVDNEINNNNKHSLRSNTKGYGDKTH
jgi:hypothetical protein